MGNGSLGVTKNRADRSIEEKKMLDNAQERVLFQTTLG